ncbi:MAG: TetR/AcrR family transcriptional regulator [Anaerosomatales bacterium]|nr:TetR/AcrR family transcriptional regulator [Anaerosomatales bacterium]MDT8434496.1 TetR/AcrR family transcriptional regulator [Anaerosomatales bacterium]
MPPTTKYDRDTIVEAAFEIAKEGGFSAISTRAVARRLGCSVAPIYQNFATVDELSAAVVERVSAMSGELLAAQTGPNPFENMGKASLAFARDYPALFREMALEPNDFMTPHEQIEDAMAPLMAAHPELAGWTDGARRRLFLKMRVFQLGLSAMVANDHLPSWMDEKAAEELLLETGEEIAAGMQATRKHVTAKDEQQ